MLPITAGIAKEIRQTIFLPMVGGRADSTGLDAFCCTIEVINHHHGLIQCSNGPVFHFLYLYSAGRLMILIKYLIGTDMPDNILEYVMNTNNSVWSLLMVTARFDGYEKGP